MILQRQEGKCANRPDRPAINLANYRCPMWLLYNGSFDDSSSEIDHIEEYSLTQNNHPSNLQALCPCCHRVKTRLFQQQKYHRSSIDMHWGYKPMDLDLDNLLEREMLKTRDIK
jgi:5-methylcytosine-specific restriction endonuclease McrA